MRATGHGRLAVICNDSAYFLRHRRIVADALAAQGHEVTVITGGPAIPGTVIGDWRYVNVPIERFAFNPVSDLRLAWRSFRHFVTERPDGVHLITLKPAAVSGMAAIAARLFGGRPTRILITIPGLGRLMGPSSTQNGTGARLSRRVISAAMRFLSARREVAFTFETHSDRDNWLQAGLVGTDNSFVINGAGVDEALFTPSPDRAAGSRPVRVLFASRLLRSKGLDAFIEAARQVGGEEVQFLVAGMAEAGDEDSFRPSELKQERSITFLGETADMPALLKSVDVVCLPTKYGEGIPRILIEAAACGLPSIASDHDGCREIVKDGVTGVVLPTGNTQAMADAIAVAVTEYRMDRARLRRHGEAGRALFLAGGFSETTVVGRFVELLTSPAGASASG